MSVYEATSYVEFIVAVLHAGQKRIARGQIAALARQLKCHSSFVSQIIRAKAFMSHEQAMRFCAFAKLLDDETEFFIDLLNRDRACTKESKTHFDRIVHRKLLERNSLQKRAGLKATLTREQEILYFQSIIHPLVHAALHLKHVQGPIQLSTTLGFSKSEIIDSLHLLEELGLATKQQETWHPTHKSIHVGKQSPLNRAYHVNWRLKIAAQLLDGQRTDEHTHYTSIFCIAQHDVERIRGLILNNLETVRKEMVASDSEQLVALCLDYFPI